MGKVLATVVLATALIAGRPCLAPAATAFQVRDFSWRSPVVEVERFSGAIEVSGPPERPQVAVRGGTIAAIAFPGIPGLSGKPWHKCGIEATVILDRTAGRVEVLSAALAVPGVGTLTARGAVPLSGAGGRAEVKGEKLQLGPVFLAAARAGKGVEANAPATLALSVENFEEKMWRFSLAAGGSGGAFHDAEFTVSGEKLAWSLSASGAWNAGAGKGECEAVLKVTSGAALLQRVLFPFTEAPLSVVVKAALAGDALTLKDLSAALGNIVKARAEGVLGSLSGLSGAALRVSIAPQPLAPALRTFVVEPFSETLPWLSGLAATGEWSCDASIKGALLRPTLSGRLSASGLSFHGESHRVEGARLDLPILLDFSGSPRLPEAPPALGSIRVERAEAPFMPGGPAEAAFEVSMNGVRLTTPFRLSALGGVIEVQAAAIRDIFSPARTGDAEVRVGSLNLAPALEKLARAPFTGTLSAPEGLRLHLAGDRVTSRGNLRAEVFGGTVNIADLRVEELFSPARLIGMGARLSGLDLESLTRATGFGTISGRLSGEVKGLEIAYGAPVAFDAALRTEDAPGIEKRMSVAAVDDISQLGTAASPFSGITGTAVKVFFSEFPYEKIGIGLTLRNDMFIIRGLVREGDVEYLVLRPPGRGVNIVNRNPDNRIGWNDMIRRLQRIGAPEGAKGAP